MSNFEFPVVAKYTEYFSIIRGHMVYEIPEKRMAEFNKELEESFISVLNSALEDNPNIIEDAEAIESLYREIFDEVHDDFSERVELYVRDCDPFDEEIDYANCDDVGKAIYAYAKQIYESKNK